MKKLIYEIAGILIAATALGLAYNLTSTDFPLVYKPKEIKIASEFDSLFASADSSNAVDAVTNIDSAAAVVGQNQQEKPDTPKTAQQEIARNEKNPVKGTEVKDVASKDIQKHAKDEQKYKIINFEQLKSRLENSKLYIIDARSPEKFAESHIKNAVNIYPFMDDDQEYYRLLNEIPMDKIIVVYCDGGNCDLSHEVANTLLGLGYTNVYLYLGGWEDWIKNKG